MQQQLSQRFGIFRQLGHVAIAFPSATAADAAKQTLWHVGVLGALARRCSNAAMRARLDHDLASDNPRAARGPLRQELKAQREFTARSCHWLLVRAEDDAQAAVVSACVRRHAVEPTRYALG